MNILLMILNKLKEYLERNIIEIPEDDNNRFIIIRSKLQILNCNRYFGLSPISEIYIIRQIEGQAILLARGGVMVCYGARWHCRMGSVIIHYCTRWHNIYNFASCSVFNFHGDQDVVSPLHINFCGLPSRLASMGWGKYTSCPRQVSSHSTSLLISCILPL